MMISYDKSVHDSVRQEYSYIFKLNMWIISIALKKLFDKINHDILIYNLSNKVSGKDI